MSLDKRGWGSLDKTPHGLQIFVPYNGVIAAGLTHADTGWHTLNLAALFGETRKIIMVILQARRTAGTGGFRTYPKDGPEYFLINSYYNMDVVIADGTQTLTYSLNVANDVWDIYCFGYTVES